MAFRPKKEIVETTPTISHEDIFGNAVKLSPELKRELDEKGLVGRFVDYKRVAGNDGHHDSGWTVYRRGTDNKSDTLDMYGARFGQSPDGLVRRGSLVLAVKTSGQVEKHRQFLKARATSYGKDYMRQAERRLDGSSRASSSNDEEQPE